MKTDPVVVAKDLSYKIDKKSILKDISFALNPGESLAVIGPNGVGKSTLIKILSGQYTNFSGDLRYKGSSQISYIPQFSKTNDILPITIYEFLDMCWRDISKSSEDRDEKILSSLKQVQLLSKKNYLMKNLSGGERQRASLAKVILQKPSLLLLDESTNGLDSTGQDEFIKLMAKIQEELQTAIVIVDHNLAQVIKHCTKVLCLGPNQHWHDSTKSLTRDVLRSFYHCELEHLILHEGEFSADDHHSCNDPKHFSQTKTSGSGND